MSLVIVGAIGLLAALLQIGPLSLFTLDPLAVPVLPVALIVGWGTVRDPGETWPALLLAPAVMGMVSQERIGVFVLALWPAAALAGIARRIDRDPAGNPARRLLAASLAAVGGAASYGALLTLASGQWRQLVGDAGPLVTATLLTALLAIAVALAVWPWRPRPRGLFG